MLVTTLAGGVLSLISLWYRRWGGLVEMYLAMLGLVPASGRAAVSPDGSTASISDRSTTLPYGVAIAAGGIAIILELAKL